MTARYLVRRLGWALVVVIGVATIAFAIAHVLPGDPARMLVGPQASASDVEHVRAAYGLEQSLPRRYVRYWQRLVHFGPTPMAGRPAQSHESCGALGAGLHLDLGHSFHYRKPVVALLVDKIPRSVELALAALGIQLLLGIGLGTFAAARQGTHADEATIGLSLLGVSAPTFLLGVVLQYVLAYKLKLLPYDGYGKTSAEHMRSIVLPALTLGIFGTALYARVVRDELSTLLTLDHVRTARAKGASEMRVIARHGLRNAVVPIATLAALDLGTLVGGAIVTEKLFRWPGVGQMAVEALLNRDGPVILGTVLFASLAVVITTLVLDVVYVVVDPRLRR